MCFFPIMQPFIKYGRVTKFLINFFKNYKMKKSKFSISQDMAILASVPKHDGVQSVEQICLEHQISPATFYKWKKNGNFTG